MEKIRLQKYLSGAGVCSRRQSEEHILAGEVSINGKRAQLGDKVDPENDKILFNNKTIESTEEKIYLALNKPEGYTTTRSDVHADQTVYDLLPGEYKNKIWPVGRLDKNSSGLLILTNDGELTQQLTHPSHKHEKEYVVKFTGRFDKEFIPRLKEGLDIDGEKLKLDNIRLIKSDTAKIILHEGKKRHIRRIFREIQCNVISLERIREQKLTLGSLKSGKYIKVSKDLII